MDTLRTLNIIIDENTGKNNKITKETSLSLDLGISSLCFYEIILDIEKTFNVKINDSEIASFETVGDVVEFLENEVKIEKKNTVQRKSKLGRATGIDIAKGLCMLGLPLIHVIEQFSGYGILDTEVFNPEILCILAVVGPAIFLICMGYDISSETKPKKLFATGVQLILICLILNVIRFSLPYLIIQSVEHKFFPILQATIVESDIYFVAGLFYILLSIFKKLKLSDTVILSISFFMMAINTVITSLGVGFGNVFLDVLAGNFFYVDDFSIFPILSNAIFPIIGMFVGKIRIETLSKRQLFERVVLVVSILTSLYVSLYYFDLDALSISANPLNEYVTELFNVLIQIGFALAFIYGLQLVIKLTKENAVERYLHKISYYLMPYFCIHWIVVGWTSLVAIYIFYEKSMMPFWMLLIIVAAITVVSLILSEKFGMKLMGLLIKITTLPFMKEKRIPNEKAEITEKTIQELVFRAAKSGNTNKAFVEYVDDTEKSISREDLRRSSAAVASYLKNEGISQKNIAIFCSKSIGWAVAFFGVTYGRNTAVLFNPDIPSELIKEQLEQTDCNVVFYPKEFEGKINSIVPRLSKFKICMPFEDLVEKANKTKYCLKEDDFPTESDVAAILFTSGTTGKSKAVKLSHLNIMSNVISAQTVAEEHIYKDGGTHSTVSILPVYHAFSLSLSVLFPLLNGGTVTFTKDIRSLVPDIIKAKPNYLTLVPQMVPALVKFASMIPGEASLKDKLGGNLTDIFVGGAVVSDELSNLFKSSGIEFYVGYGITECSPLVSLNIGELTAKDSLGFVIPGTEVKISEEGEILVRGDNVSKGYYNDPEETEAAFQDGWFKTGDLGYFGEQGELKFRGRIKNLIILSNGENVSPEVVENAVGGCPLILGVKAVPIDDHIGVEIYPDMSVPDVENKIKATIEEANKKLPEIWKVRDIVFRKEDFERTATGKIKR